MSARRAQATEERPLEVLGIGEGEENAYRHLLTHRGATAAELGRALVVTTATAQRLLETIEAKGLATHTPERPRRYLPTAPDIAMESLILRRQQCLQRARGAVQELQELAAAQRQSEPEQLVELVTSMEAERQVFEQIRRTAQNEVLTLIRPPMRISRLDAAAEEQQRAQRESQSRGVRYRSIVDIAFLTLPGAVARTRSDMEAGETVRAFPELPFKMMLADRRIAIIPLNLEQPHSASLVVRSSALLDALHALFEILWERAAPVSFTRSGKLETDDSGLQPPEQTKDLVTLMAAGLNDKSIAYELGISASTLNRRIAEIMKALDTRTRFQLGWVAALRLAGDPFPRRGATGATAAPGPVRRRKR